MTAKIPTGLREQLQVLIDGLGLCESCAERVALLYVERRTREIPGFGSQDWKDWVEQKNQERHK